jgi:ribosomal protein S18 acetylase RimI-like enzyme
MTRDAVVLGGGLAGMPAARALLGHVDTVTVVERDRYPDGPGFRKDVPQARHPHVLLSGGRHALVRALPHDQAVDMTPRVVIRPYRLEDRAALYDICVRTGHNGGDARHIYPDHELLPSIFAGPYVELEPDLAFVADDGSRAVGYIVGTADTAAFVRRYRARWLPRLTYRYPPRSGPPRTPTDEMLHLMHTPERMILPELAGYPAHLHIDLLPEYQRMGLGRSLMERFLHTLAAKGVGAVHLAMATANTRARAFYDRVGFHEIEVPDPGPVTYLGRDTVRRPPGEPPFREAGDEPLAR